MEKKEIEDYFRNIENYISDSEEDFPDSIIHILSKIIYDTPRSKQCDKIFDCCVKDLWFYHIEEKYTILQYNISPLGKEIEIYYFVSNDVNDFANNRYLIHCNNWSVFVKRLFQDFSIIYIKNCTELKKDMSLIKLMT
jgi:hypothetical protein